MTRKAAKAAEATEARQTTQGMWHCGGNMRKISHTLSTKANMEEQIRYALFFFASSSSFFITSLNSNTLKFHHNQRWRLSLCRRYANQNWADNFLIFFNKSYLNQFIAKNKMKESWCMRMYGRMKWNEREKKQNWKLFLFSSSFTPIQHITLFGWHTFVTWFTSFRAKTRKTRSRE